MNEAEGVFLASLFNKRGAQHHDYRRDLLHQHLPKSCVRRIRHFSLSLSLSLSVMGDSIVDLAG